MANELEASISLTGRGSLVKSREIDAVSQDWQIGQNTFRALHTDYADGDDDDNLANEMFIDERTVAATTADNLDLAGALVNPHGETITFDTVKTVLIAIKDPDGDKVLRVGPQDVSNAFQGWSGGVGADAYETVFDWMVKHNPFDGGWPVTAGTGDILGIYNPGADPVTYQILIIGTK